MAEDTDHGFQRIILNKWDAHSVLVLMLEGGTSQGDAERWMRENVVVSAVVPADNIVRKDSLDV